MALPIDFITRTRALLGNEFDSFEAALQADVPVSIRINEKKGTPAPSTSRCAVRTGWPGARQAITCPKGFRSPSTRSSMPAPTTYRKRRPCFSNRRSAVM